MTNKNLIKRLDSLRIDIDNMIEDINQCIHSAPSYSTEIERGYKNELFTFSVKINRIIKQLIKKE